MNGWDGQMLHWLHWLYWLCWLLIAVGCFFRGIFAPRGVQKPASLLQARSPSGVSPTRLATATRLRRETAFPIEFRSVILNTVPLPPFVPPDEVVPYK